MSAALAKLRSLASAYYAFIGGLIVGIVIGDALCILAFVTLIKQFGLLHV